MTRFIKFVLYALSQKGSWWYGVEERALDWETEGSGPPSICCVNLGFLFTLSEPQFADLKKTEGSFKF